MTEILHDEHVWVAVGFFMFLGLAAKVALPHLLAMLDARGNKIKAEIEEAAALKQEAQALLNEAEKKLQDADRSAHEIVERARFESKQIADESEKEIEAEIARKMQLAEEKIARAQSNAMESVRTKAVAEAVEAAKKIITEQLANANAANDYIKKSADLILQKIA